MGWIDALVKSRIWSSNEVWPKEFAKLTRDIQQAKTSLGPPGERARRERDRRAAALKNLLCSYDPICILSHMAQRAMFDKGASRDWYAVHGIHALVEYAVGLANANQVRGGESKEAPAEKVQEAFDLVAEVFALDWLLEQYSVDLSNPLVISRAQNLLRGEKLLDRYQGYIGHLTIILKKTFGRIEHDVISELGWNPAALPEICFAVASILQQRLEVFDSPARRKLIRAKTQGRKAFQEATWIFLIDHNDWSRKLFNISVRELAHALNWPEET